ncbi:MAG: hypothetical protein E7Z65_05925 [Thermoplasmata archaeon]|nr:hypothetical protein [Thermoplasmata archaeon]
MGDSDHIEQKDVFSEPDKDYSQEMYQTLKKKRQSKEEPLTTLAKLDRKHMLTILVYLKHHRPAIKTEIYSNISRNSGMADKLETLHKLGLIGMYTTFETTTTYIILTDKGERVATLIEDMLDEIDREEDYKPPSVYTYWKEKNRAD